MNVFQELAENGYAILAERIRREDEKRIVRETLEKVLRVHIDPDRMYSVQEDLSFQILQRKLEKLSGSLASGGLERIVWTHSVQRLFSLVGKCLQHKVDCPLPCSLFFLSLSQGGVLGGVWNAVEFIVFSFVECNKILLSQEPVLLVGETGCGKTTICQLFSILFDLPVRTIHIQKLYSLFVCIFECMRW